MTHSVQFVGRVAKVVSSQNESASGATITFHVNCHSRDGANIWFTVKAQGKAAILLIDEIQPDDVVTVFGQITPMENAAPGNIYVHAKSVCLHGLEAEQ